MVSERLSIRRVAELAKLSLSPEEELLFGAELDSILAFAKDLQQADTADVPVTAHAVPVRNVLRADAVIPPFDREEMLRNAPTREDVYITVPKTFE
ncbi:MAG: Asp-tRNA(Asn)/Glu-tRNA(Gln) amidotransferase subunit GatC [Clostridia bacterium]|nr:Asp-tRNA(Asn)/Glu-tRNA(Gln) amidotransferase subunit GatC [Clostridia bacterium]